MKGGGDKEVGGNDQWRHAWRLMEVLADEPLNTLKAILTQEASNEHGNENQIQTEKSKINWTASQTFPQILRSSSLETYKSC